DGQVRTVEAYALDRDDLELYGLPMAVEFTHHIRPMLRFDSIDELIEAMQRDVDRCRELLAGRCPGRLWSGTVRIGSKLCFLGAVRVCAAALVIPRHVRLGIPL